MTAVWQTLSALMMCAATTGLSYTFGTYSKALKAQFGLSQGQLETISVACFSCGFVTWLPGMLGDHLGPRLSVMLGGFVMSCSFGSFWAFATMRIALPSGGLLETDWAVLTLCFFSVMQYLGSAMVTGAVFTAGVRNFPTQRGLLTGLVKGWVGLCGGMTTQIFIGLVTIKDLGDLTDPAWLDFCMVASAVCLAATLVPSLFIKLHDTSEYPAFAQNVQRRVMLGYLVLLVMGTTVVSSALLEKVVDHVVVLALAIAIIIIWMSAALLALPCLDVNLSSSRVYDPLATSEDAAESEASTGLLFAVSPELGSISTTEPRASVIHEQDVNMSLVQMVQTLNFWLLLWSCMALIGAGIAVTTNNAQARPCIQAVTVASAMRVHVCACTGWPSLHQRPLVGNAPRGAAHKAGGIVLITACARASGNRRLDRFAQMFASIGSSDNVVAMTFFSVAQSASRVLSGRLCDVLKKRAFPRMVIVNASIALMVLAYGLFVWNTAASLFAGVVVAAVAFGAVWPAMVVLVSELFGQVHLGGNYMLFDGCCSAVGALLFGKFIAEAVYDAHTPAGQSNCSGESCFRLTFLLISCLLLSALAASLLLSRRTWKRLGGA
jgi:MFS family permease